jgi:peptidoglycan hydrolase-like protein with peptidoglycan-binding domain
MGGAKMSDLSNVFAVLSKNSGDIEDVITKVGGVGAFLALLPDIIRIVETLTAAGTPAAAVPATIQYSAETKASVEAFQKKNGLTVDGMVGNETWAKVEGLIAIGAAH